MIRSIFSIFGILLIAGCSSAPVSKDIPQLKITEHLQLSEGDIKVGIIRNKNVMASAIHYWPVYNRKVIGGLLTGDYIEFSLPSKSGDVGASCYGGWSSSWKTRLYRITEESPDEIYFLLSPSFTEGEQCLDMELIDSSEFHERARSSKQVPVGSISSRE
ncbi:hypothetical protein [Vibrio sp. T11.5]|uniref:hypothetical protein n=1 Tax=Vibrio sp. T11.5 TaxID=2998836 RepID=UPI0022CDB430|nr:hypothetical protein [Vibrio sp. T11.5]MDA0119774.1 hypothetical protein [Vibrio sp. T11.5]